MSALTDLGFNRPTYDEILETQENRAKELFGEQIDTSELSILGKFIRLIVSDLDVLYQTLEGVYYSRFPSTASGLNLDRLCVYAGIERNRATRAKHQVQFTGTPGETVEYGFEVSNENQSVIFYTTDDFTFDSQGHATVEVECLEAGTIGNIVSTAINTIINPTADTALVEGVELISAGEDLESDTDLRKRFSIAMAGTGSGTAEAIKGAIMRVNGVDGCTVVENSTGSTVNGISPYSFKCFVSSDNSAETDALVGAAIFEKKPIGIKSCGSVSITVEDEAGGEHIVYFDRTTKKNIYIRITLTANSYFETDGEDTIKENLINYLAGFSNGEDVYLSALYSFINIVGVVTVTSLELSTDGTTYSANNVECNYNEIARTSPDKITITVQ